MKISLKDLFAKVHVFLQKLLGGARKAEKFLQEYVDEALQFGKELLAFVNNPAVDLILNILPEKWRTQKDKALAIVNKIMAELTLGATCLDKEILEDKLTCLVDYLSTKKPLEKTGLILKIVMMWVKFTSNTNLKESVIDTIIQNTVLAKKIDIADWTPHEKAA